MRKQKIFYIDDQSFALPQLINALPNYIDYELIYVQRIEDIIKEEYDLVILDFYLDKDHKTALDIISIFRGMLVISFSTSSLKNSLMVDKGVRFGINKLQNTNKNLELQKVMENIFPKP